MTGQAVQEGSADAGFWAALPLTAAGVAAYHFGWAVGALFPAQLGGRVPKGTGDVAKLALDVDWAAVRGSQGAGADGAAAAGPLRPLV